MGAFLSLVLKRGKVYATDSGVTAENLNGDQVNRMPMLRTIMSDEPTRLVLRAFLQAEFSEENLDFFESVTNILELSADDADIDKKFFEGFQSLMDRHIMPGCPAEINISQVLSNKIRAMYQGDFGRELKLIGGTSSTTAKRQLISKELLMAQKEVGIIITGTFGRLEKHAVFVEYLRMSSSKSVSRRGSRLSFSLKAQTRILIVEKDYLTRKVMTSMLMRNAYEVMEAENCDDATELAAQQAFDWVIVDFETMTKATMSYYSHRPARSRVPVDFVPLIRQKEANRKTKFLCICSQVTAQQNGQGIVSAGFNATFVKPFSILQFKKVTSSLTPSILKVSGSFKRSLKNL
jgi:CheY-like chemotaxis protein